MTLALPYVQRARTVAAFFVTDENLEAVAAELGSRVEHAKGLGLYFLLPYQLAARDSQRTVTAGMVVTMRVTGIRNQCRVWDRREFDRNFEGME